MGFFLRKQKAGPRSLSAICLPRVRLVSAFAAPPNLVRICPPCVRLDSALAASPHFVRLVSAMCPALGPLCPRLQSLSPMSPCVCLLCLPCVFTMCPPCALASGLCPLVACWHHEVKSFLSIAQPRVYIACSVSLAFILAPQFGLCKTHPMLEKLFGAYAGIIFPGMLQYTLF